MNMDNVEVKLSSTQFEYLRKAGFLNDSLARIIEGVDFAPGQRVQLHISREDAERFRSAVSDRLIQEGFDDNYGLTEEGKILDELIDLFFV